METATRLMTAEEFMGLPNDGGLHDLIRGELRTMTRPGGEHGDIAATILWLLSNVVRPRRLGKVYAAETGFLLGRNPDTVRGADVAFIRRERLLLISEPKKVIPIAPDLAVEVDSPNDRRAEVQEKIAEWLAFGVRLLWSVSPAKRTVTVHKLGAEPVVFGEADMLDGGDVVPGFRCRVSEIFE